MSDYKKNPLKGEYVYRQGALDPAGKPISIKLQVLRVYKRKFVTDDKSEWTIDENNWLRQDVVEWTGVGRRYRNLPWVYITPPEGVRVVTNAELRIEVEVAHKAELAKKQNEIRTKINTMGISNYLDSIAELMRKKESWEVAMMLPEMRAQLDGDEIADYYRWIENALYAEIKRTKRLSGHMINLGENLVTRAKGD